jgi:hypothetical protein
VEVDAPTVLFDGQPDQLARRWLMQSLAAQETAFNGDIVDSMV